MNDLQNSMLCIAKEDQKKAKRKTKSTQDK
jgi:hypothetical protein